MIEYLKKSMKAFRRIINDDRKKAFVVLLGIAGVILLVISEVVPSDSKQQKQVQEESSTEISCDEYEKNLENRLQNIISKIEGAGNVSVMVTLESSTENIFAVDQKRNGTDGKGYENEYVIIKKEDGEGTVLIQTAQPEIRGVAVVCSGGGSAVVRQSITNTITAVLGISSARVNISVMKNSNGG